MTSEMVVARALNGGGGGAVSAPNIASDAAAQAAQQAAATAAQTQQSLARAARAVQDMQAVQAAARAAAAAAQVSATAPVMVPNGLGAGGLVPNAPGGWSGANAPTQGSDGKGQTEVNIRQTTQQAILNWREFNVGARTTLTFDQQGNRNWVALNRVDATTGPSQILGNIKADGQVYVINQSGIIFGGNSQVNVGSLIASTAGMVNPTTIYSSKAGNVDVPSFTGAGEGGKGSIAGKIVVEPGAQIALHAPTALTSGGGYLALLGSEVTNAGSLSAPKGQVSLAAGRDFIIRAGLSTDANQASTTRGNEIVAGSWSGTPGTAGTWAAGGGAVVNRGIAFAQQGDVTLTGRSILQDGVVLSTTSVNQRGTIHLLNAFSDTAGGVTLTGNSVAVVLPELDSAETALDSQRDGLLAASDAANLQRALVAPGRFDNLSLLADRQDQSRIEVVTGGSVNFLGGSYTAAQGGQIAVSAKGRIFTANGATLDVSGIRNVALAMETNNLSVNIQGFELRDSPQNRDTSLLKNATVWVDIRSLKLVSKGTGGYDTDRYYTPGGLLEVGGNLANTRHTIGEWSAFGGAMTLSANEVVVQKGAVLDISGGSLDYAGGYIFSTNLVGRDGRRYSIDQAPASLAYANFAGGFSRTHNVQGQEDKRLTEVWTSVFDRGRTSKRWEDGYTVGRDAGSLILSAPTSIFEGTVVADVVQGKRQNAARPADVADGYKLTQSIVAQAGQLLVGAYGALGRTGVFDTRIVIGDVADITAGFDLTSTLPSGRTGTLYLDAARLSEQKLGGLDLAVGNTSGRAVDGKITIASDVQLADGGKVSLAAPVIDIAADITARGGSVTAGNQLLTRGLNGSTAETGFTELTGLDGVSGVTLRGGATIDTRGLWTNALADPQQLGGLARTDGGRVTLVGNVKLEAGSLIDTSAGGSLTRKGTSFGRGGDIVLGDIASSANACASEACSGVVTLAGTLRSRGATGGALSMLMDAVLIAEAGTDPNGAQLLTPDFFRQGFSSYTINGLKSVTVADGTVVEAVQPVYEATSGLYALPTGGDMAGIVDVVLRDVYLADRREGTVTQRPGADLRLLAGRAAQLNFAMAREGTIRIGEGASLSVDPGRMIAVEAGGQVTIDGMLTAPGGDIRVLSRSLSNATVDLGGLSVWIGDHARLDAAARAFTATDLRGRRFGIVPDGGRVVLGSLGGNDTEAVGYSNAYFSSAAFIILRAGSVIDVSGTAADLTIYDGSNAVTRTVAGSGGSIAMRSYSGIYNDGTLLARSGGAGAAGGELILGLEAPVYPSYIDNAPISTDLLTGRALRIAATRGKSGLAADLAPGAVDPALVIGSARLSADEVAQGGFDTLSLFARTAILFDGDVALSAGRGITLASARLYNSVDGGQARVVAPYLKLDGQFTLVVEQYAVEANILPVLPTTGALTLQGGLIEVVNRVSANVGRLTLDSATDLRFLASPIGARRTVLGVQGDLDIVAQRVYPASDAWVSVYAGAGLQRVADEPSLVGSVNTGTITLRRPDAAPVAAPYSLFGRITLAAGTIRQGSHLVAPLGSVSLIAVVPPTAGEQTSTDQGLVELLPGSLTSTSARGLIMPYGGTADGISYKVDGTARQPWHLLTGTIVTNDKGDLIRGSSDSLRQGIDLQGSRVIGQAGAVLDVSGGGTVTGAGFVTGRGGSVDTLLTPLVNANPANTFSTGTGKVYAILPAVAVAPVAGSYSTAWTGNAPASGEQITIPAGVPGLAAGTYTLLPANYALLPGAYRVELGATSNAARSVAIGLDNGSYLTSGYRGIAGTAIGDVRPTAMIVTPGAALRSYSQYNETGYDAFYRTQAETAGRLRPLSSMDGKFLTFNLAPLSTGSTPRIESAIQFAGQANFTPASSDAVGGTMSVTAGGTLRAYNTDLVVTSPGSATARSDGNITVSAATIESFAAPSLNIGAAPSPTFDVTNPAIFSLSAGMSKSVMLEAGTRLRAGQVLVAAYSGGNITLQEGASIDTLGFGVRTIGSDGRYLFRALNGSLLAVSNGNIRVAPPSFGNATIVLKNGAAIYSEDSIGFSAARGVAMEGDVRFGTRNLELAVPSVNIGTATSIAAARAAGILPAGMIFDQAVFDRMIAGNPATGVPGMKNLILSATNSINFYGTVGLSTLDAFGRSVLDSFEFSAPAIYGYGTAQDSVSLSTDRLVWSSRTVQSGAVAAAPGASIVNGPGNGQGVFNVAAREIVFGFAANAQPIGNLQFARLLMGFREVNLAASGRIAFNNSNTLTVWQGGNWSGSGTFDPANFTGTGTAALNLITPLIAGDAGAVMSVYASGALRVTAPAAGAASTGAVTDLGATLNLRSLRDGVELGTAIALPSGKLSVVAATGIRLDDGAVLDLAGRTIPFIDVTKYSWGGDVRLESAAGDVVLATGSRIDVSAADAAAGLLTIEALKGRVVVDGDLRGEARQGAGAGLVVRAMTLGGGAAALSSDFELLNQRLNAAGFFGGRSFTFKQGDLIVGSDVRAREIGIAMDGGSLTVAGRIDASGFAPGTIRLAARDDLTLLGSAVLDVRGSRLRIDADGNPVEAGNRSTIELTSRDGWLRLGAGASMAMSSPDGIARGRIELNAGRTGETSGDIRIDAAGWQNIAGASSIAVNATQSYRLPAGSSIDQALLDGYDAAARSFMTAALGNGDLAAWLAGLSRFGTAFHLRPGVEIVSDGGLSTSGNLDLSGYRYGPGADRDRASPGYGAGEPMAFVIRAGGTLDIRGDISDGFTPPAAIRNIVTPTDLGNGYVFTLGATMGAGTTFQGGAAQAGTLPFNVTVNPTGVRRGVPIPFDFTSNAFIAVPVWANASGWTLTADVKANSEIPAAILGASPGRRIELPNGGTVYDSNTPVPAGTVLPAGTKIFPGAIPWNIFNGARFSAGTVLISASDASALGALTVRGDGPPGTPLSVPSGTPLSVFSATITISSTSQGIALAPGASLPLGTKFVGTINMTGNGPDLVEAKMLAAGSESASIRIVSGADIAGVDSRAVRSLSELRRGIDGGMTLSDMTKMSPLDPDYTLGGAVLPKVIRTGTGDLDLIAGGDLKQLAIFGIYTAGTQRRVGGDISGLAAQSGYITEGGGNVLISAGRTLSGLTYQKNPGQGGQNSYAVANWLVRQGGGGLPSAWGIRFGGYEDREFRGFMGIGTLGGGNLTVDVGEDAGVGTAGNLPMPLLELYSPIDDAEVRVSAGLVFAVGSGGLVTSVTRDAGGAVTGGDIENYGGGEMSVRIGGRLNPMSVPLSYSSPVTSNDQFGSFTNVRGDIAVRAGAIGAMLPLYGSAQAGDPRPPLLNEAATLTQNGVTGAPVVVIGDGAVTLEARGDLLLGGVGDPGMIFPTFNRDTGLSFSLWQPETAVRLFSAGGNLIPYAASVGFNGQNEWWPVDFGRNRTMLPPVFEAVVPGGSIYLKGRNQVLAPSPFSDLTLLAGRSIFGDSGSWALSGAGSGPNDVSNPLRPGTAANYFPFDPNTLTIDRRAGDDRIVRVYALDGDIVNFKLGAQVSDYVGGVFLPRYQAALPARVYAGRDVVNFGGDGAPSLLLNNDTTDMSVIQAGRDIFYPQVVIAGPGTLDVIAGRNLYLGEKGSVVASGPLAAGDTRTGASILMQAGAGAAGPNYAGLLKYLDPQNLATAGVPLAGQAGKVAKTYEQELIGWLQQRYGFAAADDEQARAYFDGLAPEHQAIFLRSVYFAELKAAGREYTGTLASTRLGSYLRGRQAIAALFPDRDANGAPTGYAGDITMFSTAVSGTPGSANYVTEDGTVRTQFGGDIAFLAPGGKIAVGVEGVVPGADAGVMTQFRGSIAMYSRDAILLGLSRIMTNYGDDILAWSNRGDINAGRGSKTTIGYTPPRRVYDGNGNVSLVPSVPKAGAGIAARSSIAGIPDGDIDLVAPEGVIDVGEAGIAGRNINLAALAIINAANITAQGNVTGVPVVQAPNIASALASSNATASTQQTAVPTQGSGNTQPSVIIVEVLGYGGGDSSQDDEETGNRRDERKASYDANGMVRVLGNGAFSQGQTKDLTEAERAKLRRFEGRGTM